ncbi:long-chain-fatty-acid--CoA ligase [Photobacterium alginatilyticum]|uniref:Long-chain fatty acid--CoA ligase n=1 Tax=Photobacterium alginatilyticum TaxID=1775171 RepID=A0ABW9YQD1_9GAMM|nr:long-chain fatty acid--CoA ligase [Photobacterium alginatilyticum]NBI55615.1 long-chain fatty acid--CoA ligase [Photobacterium alginatilyticum]
MYNLATNLERNATFRGSNTALIFHDEAISYRQLNTMVNQVANQLVKLGIKPDDKVAISCPNTPAFVIGYYAIQKVGAITVPLNVMLKGPEVAYHLDDSDAVAIISFQGNNAMPCGEYCYEGYSQTDSCLHYILIESEGEDIALPEDAHRFNQWLQSTETSFDAVYRTAEDTCVILYTSGTTGRAKGAELSQSNMLCNAQACQALTNQKGTDVSIAILPLFHTFGQSLIMNTSMLTASALVLIPRFVPKTVLQQMHKHKVTHLAGVPTMFIGLLAFAEKHGGDYLKEIADNLKVAISGGASMPVEILKQFEAKLNVPVIEGYGLSESSPVAAFNHLEYKRKPGSIGQPLPGVTMKVVDRDGNDAPQGKEGELLIRGHNVMKGYYRKPEETAKTIVNGWLHTGDIVRFDEDGYVFVVDRLKEVIIRGGYNIYPRDIEETFMTHPDVHLVAVIGVPHKTYGEEVKAFIVPKEDSTTNSKAFVAWGRERLADFKYPRQVEVVSELPMTATGKILKRLLK